MDDILDSEVQRKLAVKSLFDSHGFILLTKEIAEFVEYAETQIAAHIENHSVGFDDIGKLNYDLGVKQGLSMVLNAISQFKEELES